MSLANGMCYKYINGTCTGGLTDCSKEAQPVKNGEIIVLCSSANKGMALGLMPAETGRGYTGLRNYAASDPAFKFKVDTGKYKVVESQATLKLQSIGMLKEDYPDSESWSFCDSKEVWALDGGKDDGGLKFFGRGGFKSGQVLKYGDAVDVKIKESGGEYRIAYQKNHLVECANHDGGKGYFEMHLVLSNPKTGCPK